MSTAEIEEASNPPQVKKVGAWKPSGKRRKLQTMEEFEATHQGPPPQLGLAPPPSTSSVQVATSSTTSHAVTGGGGRGGEPSSSSRAVAAGAATLFDPPVAATPTTVQNNNTNPAGTVGGVSFPRPMSLRDLSALNSSSDVDDGGAAARRTLNSFPRINSMETVYGFGGGTNGTTNQNQNYVVPMSPAASTTTSKFNVHSTSRMRGNTTFLNESSTSQPAPPPPASPVLQDLHQLEREWNFNKSSRGEGFSRVTSTTSLCDESSGSGGGLIGGEEEHSGGGGSTLQSPVKWSRDLEVITAATDTTPSGSFGFGSFAAGGNQSGGDEKVVQSKTGIRKNKKRSPLSRVMAPPPPLQSPVFPRGVAGHLNVTRFPTTSSSSASGPSFPKTTSGTSYLMPRGGMPNSGVGSSGVSRGEGADCGMFPPTTFPAAGLRSPSENKERGGRGSSQFPLSNSEEGLRHSAGFPAAVNEGHHHQEESSTLLSPANVTDHHRPSSSPHHLAQHTLHHLHVDPLLGGTNNHNNNNNNTSSIGPTDSQTNQMTTPSKLGTNVGESGGGTKEAQFPPPTSSADGELLGGNLKGGGDPADNASTSTATAQSSIAANRAFGGGHSSTHTGFSTSTATAWKPRFMRNTAAATAPATKDNTTCSEVSSRRVATPPCEGTTKLGTVVEGKNKPPPWRAQSTTEKPPSTSSESKGVWRPRSAASRPSQPPPPKLSEDYDDDEVDESAVCPAEEQEDGTTATNMTDSFAIPTTYAGGSTITQVNPLTSPNYVTGGGGGAKTTATTTAGRGGGQQPATHYRGGAPSSIFMESEYEPDWSQFGTGALGAPASTIFFDGLGGGAEEGGAATLMVADESMKVNLPAGSMNPVSNTLAASGINSTPGGSPHGYRVGELGQYVQRKMKNGEAKLKLTDDGEGGTYFVVPVLGGGGVQSSSRTPTLGMANTPSAGSGGVSGGGGKAVGGEIIAVFKPKDEEIGCEGNPRGNTTLDLEERQGFDPGEGYIREQLAWELDYDHFAGVPETTIVSLSTKDELPSSSSAHATPSTTGGVGVTTPVSSSTTVQTGSLQRFIPSCQQSWDFGPAKFSTKVVHAIGIFDIRMLNSDRHGGNLLVPKGDKSMLVPIDHGYILPSGYSDPENLEWMDWEQSKKPFSDFELEYIAKLDREKDRNIVANRLNQDAGDTIATTTTLLQVAAPRGYNLREIAEFCRRPHLTKPSRLELLMAASRDMATLGLEMEKIDTNIKAAFPDKLDTAGKMFVNTGMSSVVNSQASDATTNPTPNAPLLIATTTTTTSSSSNKGGNQFFGIDDDSSDDDD